MTTSAITHRFVDLIPEQLEDGVLYVCIQYETVSHLCLCGCGNEVVSPLHPQQWSLTFDGTAVSLAPSIGNWSFPCQSHYWIKRNQVHWAKGLTTEQIHKLRTRDQRLLEDHFEAQPNKGDILSDVPRRRRLWKRVTTWFQRERGEAG